MTLGRPKTEVDEEMLMDMLSQGWSRQDMGESLGITQPTLRKRIAALQKKEGEILQYRALQSLELTEIEARVLEAISPQKIHEASLRDLVTAYKILKDKELVSEGRPNEIKGLVGYLLHLEKEEAAARDPSKIIEAELAEKDPDEVQRLMDEEDENVSDDDFPMTKTGKDPGDSTRVKSPFPLEDLPDF